MDWNSLNDLSRLDQVALQDAYNGATRKLCEALLNGTPWEDVQEQRFLVTTLGIALYKYRRRGSGNPAEHPKR